MITEFLFIILAFGAASIDTSSLTCVGSCDVSIPGVNTGLINPYGPFPSDNNIRYNSSGDYLFYAKATYTDKLASASTWFKVRPRNLFERILPAFIISILVFIIIFVIFLLIKMLIHELEIIR